MANRYKIVTNRRKSIVNLPSSEELVQTLAQSVANVGGGTNDLNPRILAGFPFLGQFIGHDITNDSGLSQEPSDDAPENRSTPALDLDGLYGGGPDVSPGLYDRSGRFLLGKGEFDLPRDSNEKACIGDPRNDRNLILAQLHLAFLKFHNAVFEQVDGIIEGISSDQERFERTRCLVQWHYQWIILREFLPLLVGAKMVLDVLIRILTKDSQWYQPDPTDSRIPFEFSSAAYRFGHSQIHYLYRINDGIRLPLFSAKKESPQRQDLRDGYIETKDCAVDWKYFFDTTTNVAPGLHRASKAIKPRLVGPFLFPPPSVALNRKKAGDSDSLSGKALALRDLERGEKRRLPSGQEVANEMQSKKINVRALAQDAPLWYYVLKEAEVQYAGKMLGDVGGRIVAEVIINLLQADPNSFWKEVDLTHLYDVLVLDRRLDHPEGDQRPLEDRAILGKKGGTWKPKLSPRRVSLLDDSTIADFTIADLLTYPPSV